MAESVVRADVMIVAPHPDDAELGMGGTISSMIASGLSIVIVDLTNGEPTPFGSPEIRAEETSAASKTLGLQQRELMGLVNREVFDTVPNRKKLAGLIRNYKPKLLFAPYWEDAHPDHLQACALVEGARFYSKFVKSDLAGDPHYPSKLMHFFSTHIRPRFSPSFVVDISSFIDAKMSSLACYHSQFGANPRNLHVLEMIRTEARYWGFQIQREYGEPFVCRESVGVSDPKMLLAM